MRFLGALLLSLFVSFQVHAYETAATQAILLDYRTGAILFEKNADELMAPSSMSKVMTVYMLFLRLREGTISLEDTLPVSEKAWRMGGSKMFVKVGDRVRVEDLLRGIITQSGNDACVVLAEALASSEEAFAEEMTKKAREIGMTKSTFKNATGWPDPDHLTTARDLAILAKRIIDEFPEYYRYFAELTFTYNRITQPNRNPLLGRTSGVDGLKTGHTEVAGYGLTASAMREGRRLILVVNGLGSMKQRASESEFLMEWGFREFDNYPLFGSGETVADVPVWLGDQGSVPLVIKNSIEITLPKKVRRDIKVIAQYNSPIAAPIKKGDKLGKLVIKIQDSVIAEYPLLAGADAERLGLLGRLKAAFKYVLWGSSN